MWAELVNEAYRFRSSFLAANTVDGAGFFDTEPLEFVDPIVFAQREKVQAAVAEAQSHSQDDFESQLGY